MFDGRCVALVDTGRLRKNAEQIKDTLANNVKLMSVVKADGYGHGIKEASKAFRTASDWFAVTSFEEGADLRSIGIDQPILVLGYVPLSQIRRASQLKLTVSGFSEEYILAVNEYCLTESCQLDMHLKIDTGFNRLGEKLTSTELSKFVSLYQLKGIQFTGIYTHFPAAGEDREFTLKQYQNFQRICQSLSNLGIEVGLRHCCNSKAMLLYPEMHMDMVRVGVYLYGIASPTDSAALSISLALSWQARLILTKEIKKGETVSYGRTFEAPADMRIGVLTVGFGDGYFRSLGNNTNTEVYFSDQPAKIIGKICMDYLIVDLTSLPKIKAGCYAELIGKQSNPYFLGKKIQSTAGELFTSIGQRVPRIYRKEGKRSEKK
ncbi:alanine racemase [Candidatus Enterococcus ferrettii]|uniref:Alanine racemase n=1 Tax=Candidatus Enterococcus ferrettii TaxID=2815324 RepID=A0ABV0EJ42_9ENTE|nr:alanine racemase [Enterococcus sp. 665A]MBO1339197.1 alanine racemase [Enterococcus sp. 665A]